MKRELQELNTKDLQRLFIVETKRFIEALDDGSPIHLLQPMREKIKTIGQLLDNQPSSPAHPSSQRS